MSEFLASGGGLSRRRFLGVTAAAGMVLAGCTRSTDRTVQADPVAVAESRRPHSGRTVSATLTAQRTRADIGGVIAETLSYNDTVPGPLLRASVGDELAVTVRNRLSEPTSVHWHGIALRNDMDGAAPATPNIDAGRDFIYRFSVPHPGTYWAHPHTGLQADTGLYLPVIVDDPMEPGDYDAEWVVMLDDWTDGVGSSPQQLYEGLRAMAVLRTICRGWETWATCADQQRCPGWAARAAANCSAAMPEISPTRTT